MTFVPDSVTVFPPDARGRAAIAASHGGVYAAYLAAKAGDQGGDPVRCRRRTRARRHRRTRLSRALGVAAATVGHRSARIGDGADCARAA